MKKIIQSIILIILLLPKDRLYAQQFPQFIIERIAFCNSNLSDKQASELKNTFFELERYFIKKKLLSDTSGKSYIEVYKKIAASNDLAFQMDTSFTLLNTLEINIMQSCLYKLLTPVEMSKLTERHLTAAINITTNHKDSITLKMIAQKVLDNLNHKDFELEFFKISSLFAFYAIAIPAAESSQVLLPPAKNEKNLKKIKNLKIHLNKKGQIVIKGELKTLNQVQEIVYDYLQSEPSKKGIEISTSKDAGYESFISLLNAIEVPIDKLREKLSKSLFNLAFFKLSIEQRKKVEEEIPKNLFIREVK